jgi:Protein of unknown function (DUF1161)
MPLTRCDSVAPLRRLVLAMALMPAVGMANNCEAIQQQIEARIKASGATGWTLTTVPVDTQLPGKVVGQCDLGRRKIVYQAGTIAAARAEAPILTECRDGSVSLGGDCPKRP